MPSGAASIHSSGGTSTSPQEIINTGLLPYLSARYPHSGMDASDAKVDTAVKSWNAV